MRDASRRDIFGRRRRKRRPAWMPVFGPRFMAIRPLPDTFTGRKIRVDPRQRYDIPAHVGFSDSASSWSSGAFKQSQ